MREPRAKVDVEVRHSYRNMRPFIEENPRVVEAALEAIRRAGVEPRLAITRGGTDGAVLSAQGLPTPNLFTGGQEYHSVREWASVQDMAAAAATIVELAGVWAESPGSRRVVSPGHVAQARRHQPRRRPGRRPRRDARVPREALRRP